MNKRILYFSNYTGSRVQVRLRHIYTKANAICSLIFVAIV